MTCPKCQANVKKITEEGSYCVSCGFIYYCKFHGSNALEIEQQRLNLIQEYLKQHLNNQISLSTLSNVVDIPLSILRDLINQLMDRHQFFLNIIDE